MFTSLGSIFCQSVTSRLAQGYPAADAGTPPPRQASLHVSLPARIAAARNLLASPRSIAAHRTVAVDLIGILAES